MEKFEDIRVLIIGKCQSVSESEIAAAEERLGCTFPTDYRRFIQKFGPGYFREMPLRIFSPSHILATTSEDQQRLKDYWFWNESSDVLTQKDAVRSIACFDTDIGHDIRFLPEDESTMYVLFHEKGSIERCRSFMDIVRVFEPNYTSQVYEFHPFKSGVLGR